MEETAAYIAGGISLCLVVLFSLADAALSEFSWQRLEQKLKDDSKLREFSKLKLRMGISVKIMIAVFNALFAVSGFFAIRCRAFADPADFLVGAGIIVASLLLCDMVPDLLGRRNPDSVIAALLPVLGAAEKALRPLNAAFAAAAEVLGRIIGFPAAETDESELVHEELMSAISGAKHGGAFADGEDRMLKSILEFRGLQISEIMTPRIEIFAIQADTAINDAAKQCFEQGHSRIPIYRENLDDITGVLYVKDLLLHWGDPAGASRKISEIAREPNFVPETKIVGDLLVEFKKDKVHIAVVMDEYGGTAGIITIEDIIEEIIGEIEDEFDEKGSDPVEIAADGSAIVDARINVYEINEALGISIPESGSYDTLSGFIFSKTGRIPEVGESISHGGVAFTILDADHRRISRVKVVKAGGEE